MIDTTNYIENIGSTLSTALFYIFIATVSILAMILILSLFFLILGSIIKSQKVKNKFLKASTSILVVLITTLAIPGVIEFFKSFI